jgi:hypothetical protein
MAQVRGGNHVTFTDSRLALAGVFLLVVTGYAQQPSATQLPAVDLVKAVMSNETKPSGPDDIRWKYRLSKNVDGKQETREVVETKSGSLDRLLAIADKPLSVAQQRDETERILSLSHDPGALRKMEQARRKDAEQCEHFLQMIPKAFVFEYAGESGNFVKVVFKPNPDYRPESREARVLHEMGGEIWVNAKQQRLASINGQLLEDVNFGGGLLGHLDKGGQFRVKRAELASGHWEITEMNVNMHGKALMFKSISVQQNEVRSDFQAVPDDLTLADAAGVLLGQSLVAEKR